MELMFLKRYLHLLADVDGTLIDSNDLHSEAWVEAFARFGHEVDVRAVRKLIGMGGNDIVRFILSQEEADDQTEELSEAHKEIFERRFLPAIAVIGEPASRNSGSPLTSSVRATRLSSKPCWISWGFGNSYRAIPLRAMFVEPSPRPTFSARPSPSSLSQRTDVCSWATRPSI